MLSLSIQKRAQVHQQQPKNTRLPSKRTVPPGVKHHRTARPRFVIKFFNIRHGMVVTDRMASPLLTTIAPSCPSQHLAASIWRFCLSHTEHCLPKRIEHRLLTGREKHILSHRTAATRLTRDGTNRHSNTVAEVCIQAQT